MSDPSTGPTEAGPAALLAALAAVARRLDIAARLDRRAVDPALQAIVDTVVLTVDAQAASIALHDVASDRLIFVAAAGPAAGEVVGLGIAADAGIAGYAFSSGQPLAIADATADPRFDRAVAEATGYLPGSLLATPLADETGVLGVLEILDRRGQRGFDLHDLEMAASFARQAAITIRSARMTTDGALLLRAALVAVHGQAGARTDDDAASLDAVAVEALVSAATRDGLGADPDDPTWQIIDRLARLRDVDPAAIGLATDWLDALIRRGSRERWGGR